MKSASTTAVSRIASALFNALRVWSNRFEMTFVVSHGATSQPPGRNGRLYGYRPWQDQTRPHSSQTE